MKLVFKHIRQQIIVMICCFSFLGYSQPQHLSEAAQISVLTCGTSDELYALFGHTALRVQDEAEQLDVVFNYGMFDFQTPNFYGKFIKGDLIYYLDADRYSDFVANYREDNRSVYEQPLNLSSEQKQRIWTEIRRQFSSQERYYQYKFIDNNCTTKVVDLLNDVLPAPLETKFPENQKTYREILNGYLDDHYFEKLGINLLFGAKADHLNTKLSLPNKLLESIDLSKNGSEKLSSGTRIVFESRSLNKGVHWNSVYAFSLFCLIVMVGCFFSYRFRKIYMFLMGFLGVFLTIIGFYSSHSELHWNNVILMCSPFFLFYIFVKDDLKIKYLLYYVISGLFVLYLIVIGLEKLKIFIPLVLLNIVVLFLERRTVKKNIK